MSPKNPRRFQLSDLRTEIVRLWDAGSVLKLSGGTRGNVESVARRRALPSSFSGYQKQASVQAPHWPGDDTEKG